MDQLNKGVFTMGITRDGTFLTMISDALPFDRALDFPPSFQADLSKFGWIGNLSSSNFLTYTC